MLVLLGVAHVIFGVVKFRVPLLQAVSSGFTGKFLEMEVRRTAFWFVLFGFQLVLAGRIAVRAANTGEMTLLSLIGTYVLAISLVGVAAFPKSPFPASPLVGLLSDSCWSSPEMANIVSLRGGVPLTLIATIRGLLGDTDV